MLPPDRHALPLKADLAKPVASRLSRCADASALPDPLTESTLLAVGAMWPVGGQSRSFGGFFRTTAAAPRAL
ncbi:hypothetical protein Q5P01_020541 [Channa striata]|uniref:Uncharacterized protein n=1 Tax=Channa striata TaxID=64152 RepID=A0AA88S1J0_CHASR|nr:hypothetical protein Q5P01_020541 [Channa striata]